MNAVQDYSVANLKVHPRNNEFFDDISGAEYEQFKTSIQNEGILTPLIVAPDLTVISGHQRLKAATELGMTFVPVIIRHDIQSDEDKIAALLAANFGRIKNNETKQRKIAVEYVKLRGNKHGGDRNSSGDNRRLKISEIAEQLGTNERSLRELLDIERKLTPEIRELLDGGAFTKTTASKILTKLSKEEQKELVLAYGKEIIDGVTAVQMQEYVNQLKAKEQEIENIKADYEIKLTEIEEGTAISQYISDKDELVAERNRAIQEARNNYEMAQKYKTQAYEAAKKIKEPEDYKKLKTEAKNYDQNIRRLLAELEEKDRELIVYKSKAQEAKIIASIPMPDGIQTESVDVDLFQNVCSEFLKKVNPFLHLGSHYDVMTAGELSLCFEVINDVQESVSQILENINNIKEYVCI